MNFHEFILIGVLFQFFDINIGTFDVIPDFVGFLMIAYAFSRAKARYAKLGMWCAAMLSISSLVEVVWPSLLEDSVNLWLQILAIILGLVTILYFACIFSVSKDILQGEDSRFPIVFISVQLVVELFTSIGMHLSLGISEGLMIVVMVLLFGFYIYFIVFLWQRVKRERVLLEEVNGSS